MSIVAITSVAPVLILATTPTPSTTTITVTISPTPTTDASLENKSGFSLFFGIIKMMFNGSSTIDDGTGPPDNPPGGDVEEPPDAEYDENGNLIGIGPGGGDILLPPGTNTIPGTIPAGHCESLLTRALQNLKTNEAQVLPVYQKAASQTGVPWEYLAAIHYIETGASFNPNGSLISGRPIGAPEPDQGGQVFGSLLESAIAAANKFRGKIRMVDFVRRNNGIISQSPSDELETLMGQFASYNAPTQGECEMSKTTFVYTGRTWPGIPDRGQCNGRTGSHTKGEKFVGDRHVYSAYCLDDEHNNMYFHFHHGDEVVKFDQRLGAIALIRGIRQRYQVNQSPTSVPPADSTFLRNPTDSGPITTEVIQKCQVEEVFKERVDGVLQDVTRNTIRYGKMQQCMPLLTSVSSRFRSRIVNNYEFLQCTQYAVALANEINGSVPSTNNACQMVDQPANSQYTFIPRGSGPPQPGDLVIWNSPDPTSHHSPSGYCGAYNVLIDGEWKTKYALGHIAYISRVDTPNRIEIAEANINFKGEVKHRYKDLTALARGWLRKKNVAQ